MERRLVEDQMTNDGLADANLSANRAYARLARRGEEGEVVRAAMPGLLPNPKPEAA